MATTSTLIRGSEDYISILVTAEQVIEVSFEDEHGTASATLRVVIYSCYTYLEGD